jgi:hypothetical protein
MSFGTNDQRSLWPAYAYPDWWNGDTSVWARFADYASTGADRSGSLAVMNPASGPGAAVNPDYTAAVNYVRNAGQRVVGYTHTSYGQRPEADVKAEVDAYYGWYPVDGIFVDEMSTDPATQPYYHDLYAYIRAKFGQHLVVGNPGTAAATDWQVKATTRVCDVAVIFEGDAAAYLGWMPPAWVSAYPASTFGHLVYAASAADLPALLAHSKAATAGYRYVTDDGLPNPWDSLGLWPAQASP